MVGRLVEWGLVWLLTLHVDAFSILSFVGFVLVVAAITFVILLLRDRWWWKNGN
jgi:hypothetical protein